MFSLVLASASPALFLGAMITEWLLGKQMWFISKRSVNQLVSSFTQSCLMLYDPVDHSMPGLPVHQVPEFTKLMSIELVMPSNHLILCCPLFLPPSIFLSIRVFSDESVLHIKWPKYWSFSFSISPSSEYSRLISFRMDWLDLLAGKGLSRVFSNTTVQKHQFFGAQPSLQSNSHIHT